MRLLWCLESLPRFLMVAIILIKNAEWQRNEGKSDCATLLPPINANEYLAVVLGPSTAGPQAQGCRFESIVGTFS